MEYSECLLNRHDNLPYILFLLENWYDPSFGHFQLDSIGPNLCVSGVDVVCNQGVYHTGIIISLI